MSSHRSLPVRSRACRGPRSRPQLRRTLSSSLVQDPRSPRRNSRTSLKSDTPSSSETSTSSGISRPSSRRERLFRTLKLLLELGPHCTFSVGCPSLQQVTCCSRGVQSTVPGPLPLKKDRQDSVDSAEDLITLEGLEDLLPNM